jgi:hypothetical protein
MGLYELSGRFVSTERGLRMVGIPLRLIAPELSEVNLEAV